MPDASCQMQDFGASCTSGVLRRTPCGVRQILRVIIVLHFTIYPVSDSYNFRGLTPTMIRFPKKTRSEPEVALIDTSPEVAPDNDARAEPRWRRNHLDAKGDATELARKIRGKLVENMHDKHVIKPGKKRSSMDQTQSLFLPLPFVLRSLRISSPSPYHSLPISFQPLSISFHLYPAPLPMLSAASLSASSLRLRRYLGSACATLPALPGATSGNVV